MKKITFLIIICMLFNMLCITAPAEENAYADTLRVGISYASKTEAWFYSDSPVEIIDAAYFSYITTVPAGVKFNVTATGGMLQSEYFSPTASAIRLESASVISCNDAKYRGSFELMNKNDKITVINIVNTEEYLASVLGKEMSPSWPIEALKAQAVCARNFAIKNIGKHSSYGFDICSTQDCQVYAGISSEAERTRQAVSETQGVLVKYQGKVVPLFYFSCDGGYTENSENVWVSAEGYLRGKKDIYENPEYATYYDWSKTFTKTEIEDILAKKNMSVGELLDIRIDEMSENNGVIKLTFVGTEGEETVSKTSTRTILSLNSQAYTIEKHTAEPVVKEEVKEVTVHVLTANGIVKVTNPEYALGATGLYKIPYEVTKVQEATGAYESYTFNGHGWGHLVGMSQWGAYSMAVAGYNYKDILNFYFTDIEIAQNSFAIESKAEGEEIILNDEIQRNDTGI